MDEFFEYFIESVGEPCAYIEVPSLAYTKYKGILPDALLSYWEEYGWSPFANGLIWLTNPEDYENIVQEWIEGIPELEGLKYYVLARTAFGSMYAFQPEMAQIIKIFCVKGVIVGSKEIIRTNKELEIQTFFSSCKKRTFDLEDDHGNSLFDQAFEKFGALDANEVYGFQPFLVLGGTESIENIQKVRLDVHLDIMCQFTDLQLYLI